MKTHVITYAAGTALLLHACRNGFEAGGTGAAAQGMAAHGMASASQIPSGVFTQDLEAKALEILQ